jgi:hypothetical protein
MRNQRRREREVGEEKCGYRDNWTGLDWTGLILHTAVGES